MSYVLKRVLLLTKDVKFAVNAKKALERHGSFDVVTFTRGTAAVDHARGTALDVAVIDFRLTDIPGTDVIDHLRAIQPNIAIIAAPEHPAVIRLKDKHNIQAIVDIPLPLRKFLELLHTAMNEMYEAQPDTRTGPPLQEGDTVPLQVQSNRIEFWVADQEGGGTLIEVEREPSRPLRGSEAFQKLLAEEPPRPSVMEGSTIRDVHVALRREEDVQTVAKSLEESRSMPTNRTPSEEPGATAAKLILETAFDQSTPIQEFSATEFLETVKERADVEQGEILPLPSWLAESERYIREPEFLPEDLLSFTQPLEYTSTPTAANPAMIEDGQDLLTDRIEPVRRSHPPQEPIEKAEDSAPLPPPPPEFESPLPDIGRLAALSGSDEPPPPPTVFAAEDDQNPQMAQLALTLTQVSLELASEAILLAQGDELMAYAGDLPEEDIYELRDQVQGDWRAEERKTRMRFFTLSSSGKDYMLYTMRTEGNYVLTMIFAGNMPLDLIRRQSERLSDALAEIQAEGLESPAEEPEEETFAAASSRTAYSFAWLLLDPEDAMTPPLARYLAKKLEQELIRKRWRVVSLDVQEDYVNLLAEFPEEESAREVIFQLMDFSAEVVHEFDPDLDPAMLWADSYLVQRGDAPLDVLEIQDFINFVRE